MSISEQLGLLRSRLIYYGKPGNRWRLRRFYRQFIQPGDLCFDIGAHLGNRSDAWLALGARVVAVEPQPSCTAYLTKKFSQNPNFTLVEKGVDKHPGQRELHISAKTPTVTTFAGRDWQRVVQKNTPYKLKWDRTTRVEMITLDELIQQFGTPSFCKIDVEDFEFQVLSGLSQAIPALSFEYFTKTIDRIERCVRHLQTLTCYQYNWSVGESQRFAQEPWVSAEELLDILTRSVSAGQSGDIYARKQA